MYVLFTKLNNIYKKEKPHIIVRLNIVILKAHIELVVKLALLALLAQS